MGIEAKLEKISQKLSDLWMLGVFVIFVYYTDNAYFNMLEAKAQIFQFVALLFVGFSTIVVLGKLNFLPVKATLAKYMKSLNGLDYFVFLFGVSSILSNLVTEHKNEALLGSYGWSVGTIWVIGLCAVYFYVSSQVKLSKAICWIVGAATGLQYVLVVLNGFYVDVFSLHQNLAAKDYVRYVGTIGNTNWYVGYVVMTLPFLLLGTHYLKVAESVGLRLLLIFATMSCITINCQGVYLGVGGILFFYLLWAMKNKRQLMIALMNFGIMTISVGILAMIGRVLPMVSLDGINSLVITAKCWGSVLGLVAVVAVILAKTKEEHYNKIRKYLQGAVVLLGVVFAGVILTCQIKEFDDHWGTNRGRIWKVAVKAFRESAPVHKLFGVGTNCFGFCYKQITGSDWVRNAHNEFLEYLVTTGILGLVSYVGIYAQVLLRKGKDNAVAIACKLAVVGYMAQAVVNNPQALNGAIFFTILAIYRRSQKEVL